MIRKLIPSIVIIIFISSVVSNAQPRRTPVERARMLKEQLNLTDVQTAKVDSIYTAADKTLDQDSHGNFDRAKFRSIMDETHKDIEKILTKEQNEKYQKLIQERRSRMRGYFQNRKSN
jgi:Spy/CpxP family protein refolding chaperone